MRRLLLTCLFATLTLHAQEKPTPAQALPNTFTQKFQAYLKNRPALTPRGPQASRWLDGGDRFTVLEPAADTAPDPAQIDLVAYDTASGKRSVLIPAGRFIPAGASKPLPIDDYQWSADKRLLLIYTNSQKVWRSNTRGDYWLLDLAAGKLTKLGADAPAASMMFAKFSPDSRSVAFVRANNIYVQDLATLGVRQITADGSADIINGTTDWVTEEELGLRDAFRWSPDSRSILFLQQDQSGEGEYTLLNDTKALYPVPFVYKYPQPGTTNASSRLGVVSAAGGSPTWIKLSGDPRNMYIPRFDWVGDANQIALEYLNRAQNTNQVLLADATTGDAHLLFEDKDSAWVDINKDLTWLSPKPGAPAISLLWLSERDGWRHAYAISRSTGRPTLLTNFAADVIETVGVDQQAGFYYFTASPTDPIRAYLYRARLDGSGAPERVTPAAQSGYNYYDLSPNGNWAVHYFSSYTVPPRFDLLSLPADTVVRTLVTNDDLVDRYAKLNYISAEEFADTSIGEGLTLSTHIVKPPSFDPAKKWPVIVEVYGEPAATTVTDGWYKSVYNVFVSQGYVYLSFDNQGTPAPRGRAWRKTGYGAIGVVSTEQQAAAIRAFAQSHPWVDTSRMAIMGHSGGGTNTLNMMFRNPGLYAAGIAGSPVPDQAHYDTIYQERYMGLPDQNPSGYHDGSAINFAQGLTGNLLIVHGSGDDNVHIQGTEMLVNRLIELGKPFDYMVYPNRTHSLSEGPGTTLHRYSLMDRFLEAHVPPGPR